MYFNIKNYLKNNHNHTVNLNYIYEFKPTLTLNYFFPSAACLLSDARRRKHLHSHNVNRILN